MIAVIKILRKTISLFVGIAAMLFAPLFGDFTADFIPREPYEVKLDFAVISDVHMTDEQYRKFTLSLGLQDMAEAKYPLDALVVSGDITDHGYREQWDAIAETFSTYNKVENVILAMGNHDTWSDENDEYADAPAFFKEYNKTVSDRELEEVYYSTKINGYTFVVLGSEASEVDAYISPAQLEWLEETMEEASKDSLPIFVISHQPLNGSFGLPEIWGDDEPQPADGGLGDESEAVEAILKKYENVFLISGHLHTGMSNDLTQTVNTYNSVESDGSFHSVNLPCYMFSNCAGPRANGTGFVFEVYNDSVLIRGRSFSAGVWYTCYEYDIPLV